MNRGTLNSINSGPNGGKTTLYMQALAAHVHGKPFDIPGLNFPEGKITIVQTDRPSVRSQPLMSRLGIWNHPDVKLINFVDDDELHKLTRPVQNSQIVSKIEQLRTAIEQRMPSGTGTLVLDLYDDFQAGDNTRTAAYYSRTNSLWSVKLNVVILGIIYCFKQSTAKQSSRIQDRASGFTQNQASMDWKFTLVDSEELKVPYGMIGYTPPQGEGGRGTILTLRGDVIKEQDPFGLFHKYTGEVIPSIEDIQAEYGIEYAPAWKRHRALVSEAKFAIEAGDFREDFI